MPWLRVPRWRFRNPQILRTFMLDRNDRRCRFVAREQALAASRWFPWWGEGLVQYVWCPSSSSSSSSSSLSSRYWLSGLPGRPVEFRESSLLEDWYGL